MNVLLVEPDRLLGSISFDTISEAGHVVVWERSGQTAIDALEKSVPDVIVLEVNLGVHNGLEFLYEIRSYAEWQNIPVIIYTSNHRVVDDIFASSLYRLGVIIALNKTEVDLQTLLGKIAETRK